MKIICQCRRVFFLFSPEEMQSVNMSSILMQSVKGSTWWFVFIFCSLSFTHESKTVLNNHETTNRSSWTDFHSLLQAFITSFLGR